MKALVTGGSGFIGGAIVRALERRKYQVTIFDVVPPDYKTISPYVAGDVRRDILLNPHEYDVVFHCAGLLGTETLFDRVRDAMEVNVIGTVNVMEWAAHGITVVQPNLMGDWFNPYMISKHCGEKVGMMYGNYLSVRPTDVYGPRQPLHQKKAASTFITNAIRNEPLPIYGSGRSWVNYVYVDDVADFIVTAFQKGARDEIIDFCYPNGDLTVAIFAVLVIQMAESHSTLEYLPMRRGQPGDINPIAYDLSRAHELYDMTNLIPLEQGLKKAINWYRLKMEADGK